MPYMRVIPPGLDFTMLKVSIRLLVLEPAMHSLVKHEHLRPCGVHGADISLPLPACTSNPLDAGSVKAQVLALTPA